MRPFVFDFDNDGDGDLLIGTKDRFLTYFENTGSTTNPAFTEVADPDQHPYKSLALPNRYCLPRIMTVQYKTWTFVIASQAIAENQHVAVTQGGTTGK